MGLVLKLNQQTFDLADQSARHALKSQLAIALENGDAKKISQTLWSQIPDMTIMAYALWQVLSPLCSKTYDLWDQQGPYQKMSQRLYVKLSSHWLVLPKSGHQSMAMIVTHYALKDASVSKKYAKKKNDLLPILSKLWLRDCPKLDCKIKNAKTDKALRQLIRSCYDHVSQKDCYGEISSDSDSEDEAIWQNQQESTRGEESKNAARIVAKVLGVRSLNNRVDKRLDDLLKRWVDVQNNPKNQRRFQFFPKPVAKPDQLPPKKSTQKELDEINAWWQEQNPSVPMPEEETPFYMSFWRGIHFYTSVSRQERLQSIREAKATLFASEVRRDSQENSISPEAAAEKLDDALFELQKPGPVRYGRDTFNCPFDALQQVYSGSYDKVVPFYNEWMNAEDEIRQNPFVSCSQMPHHSVLYAIGGKPYSGHKDQMMPRWKKNGQGLDRCIGVIYGIKMPLDVYLKKNKANVSKMIQEGKIRLSNTIASEQEVSFSALIEGEWVYLKLKIKLPSFHRGYQDVYLKKYGLTATMYQWFFKRLKQPDATVKKGVQQLLVEYIGRFHEAQLIEWKHDEVIVFEEVDGFHTRFPQVPTTASPPMKEKIMAQRDPRSWEDKTEKVIPLRPDKIVPQQKRTLVAGLFKAQAREHAFNKSLKQKSELSLEI